MCIITFRQSNCAICIPKFLRLKSATLVAQKPNVNADEILYFNMLPTFYCPDFGRL